MKFAILAALILLPGFAYAQSFDGSTTVPPFTLSVSPTYPVPYGNAIVSVGSTVLDLGNATLSLSVAGKNVYQGNVQPVSITIGGPGVTTVVKAIVVSAGQSYTKTLSLKPGDVSLVEEPVASVPPLYAGKPLVPLSGQVRLVAVAAFTTAGGMPINPASLSYTWSQDDTALVSYSGIGRSAITVMTPLEYRAGNFSVIVSTQDGSQVGGGTVSLTGQNPSIRIYANDPLLGIRFDHALAGSYTINDTEASFYVAPYSFSLANGATPVLAWSLNASAAGSSNVVTLRPTGQGTGSGTLSVSANEDTVYESALSNLSLSFGTTRSTNIFGL